MQYQVTLLLFIRILRMFMIMMPVIVLYWQSHGLQMKDIFVLQVIFSIGMVIFEVPTGYFSDRFGHRTAIIVGCICGTVGFFFYWSIPTYVGFILGELILAIGSSFMSGARDALLYDTLEAANKETQYTKIQGRQSALGNVSEAVAAITAGIVVWYSSIATVLLLQWCISAITIPLAFTLSEVRSRKNTETPTLRTIVRQALHENVSLRYLNVIAGGISATTLTIVWFSQPHWEQLGVPILYFGYLWAGLNLCAALGSAVAHRLEHQLTIQSLLGILATLPLLLYMLTSFFAQSLLVFAVIPFFWLLRGVATPIIQDYVQRACKASERATVLSINALASRLVFSVCSPFLGWVADVWTFQTAFLASGIIYGSITLIGYVGFVVSQTHTKNTH
jgi:MFS family permease